MSEQHDIANWPDQPEMIYHMPYLEDIASRCSVIVEIGCGHGNGSTRAFERGLLRTTHPAGARLFVSVDDNEQKPDVRPTIPCWRKVLGDSRHGMPEAFLQGNYPVDLVYVDTEHTYEHLAAELVAWHTLPGVGEHTTWLFHDTFMFGSFNHMTDAITDFCAANPQWEYVEITKESHGMGMMRWRTA